MEYLYHRDVLAPQVFPNSDGNDTLRGRRKWTGNSLILS
ncbi:hypothetical protein T07_6349 [Trichinella nelsoni]|uniref:Uncharacterized protein n=1 Tax=Trichinella nelsoni TaxID=6336 RepID=A0A0V0RA68_9BILA|nr:hypothetical protein T07_6349 [Trichinella nelsoni]